MEISPISSIDNISKTKTNIEENLSRETTLKNSSRSEQESNLARPENEMNKILQSEADDIREATGILNEVVKIFNEKVSFDIHEDTGKMFVKVLDTQTDTVIRTIPPKEILDLSAKLQRLVGIILDTTG